MRIVMFVLEIPTIQEEGHHEEEEETKEPHSSPTISTPTATATVATPPPSPPQALLLFSPPTVEMSFHLTSTPLIAPIIELDFSSSTTSLLPSSSLPAPLPMFSNCHHLCHQFLCHHVSCHKVSQHI